MKTKPILPFYQDMGIFDQQMESRAFLDELYYEILLAQMKVQTSVQEYLTM